MSRQRWLVRLLASLILSLAACSDPDDNRNRIPQGDTGEDDVTEEPFEPSGPCAAGTHQTAAPTASEDRVCTPCPADHFCTGGETAPQPHTPSCPVTTHQTQAPSSTLDRVCTPCPAEHFCAGDTAAPEALIACEPELQEPRRDVPTDGSATENRICCAVYTVPEGSELYLYSGEEWPTLNGEPCLILRDSLRLEATTPPPYELVRVDGNIYMDGYLNGTDLNALTGLEEIGGNLHINESYTLTDMQGLSALRRVGGAIELSGLDLLTNLSVFSNLQEVDSLSLNGLGSLSSLGGLDALHSLNALHVNSCDQLTNLEGFPASLISLDMLSVQWNLGLQNLVGLEHLSSIGTLRLRWNEALTSLEGLDALESVTEEFDISNNEALCETAAYALASHIGIDNELVTIVGNQSGLGCNDGELP